jgi:hypothetical protein
MKRKIKLVFTQGKDFWVGPQNLEGTQRKTFSYTLKKKPTLIFVIYVDDHSEVQEFS